MSKLLALDWGSKQIGVAVGDAVHKLAYPRASLPNDQRLIEQLRRLVAEEAVQEVIVGLPRNMKGEETAQSQTVRQFGSKLKQKLALPVQFQDESLTTLQAEQQAMGHFDQHSLAAVIILQDYLDERKE